MVSRSRTVAKVFLPPIGEAIRGFLFDGTYSHGRIVRYPRVKKQVLTLNPATETGSRLYTIPVA